MVDKKPQFTAWSSSRLGDYDKCPAYAAYKHLTPAYKGWDQGGAAANRGTEIHEAAAAFVAGHTKTLHKDLRHPKVAKLLRALRKGYVERRVWTELMLGLDRKWQLLRDKWSPEIWLRVKCDIIDRRDPAVVRIVDWKSGREKSGEEYDEQMNLYCVGALCAYPGAQRAEASLMFTDTGSTVVRAAGMLERADLPTAQKTWEKRVKGMFADTWFAPKPGRACDYCPFSRNSGREDAPCEF